MRDRMKEDALLAVVLAAGQGTRMKSRRPKVLHKVAGRPMVSHAVAAAKAAGAARIALVVAPGMDAVADAVRAEFADATSHVQAEALGTGHAVLAARDAFADHDGPVLVLYGDTPLLRPETLERVAAAIGAGANVVVAGFEARDPAGYGRLITGEGGDLVAIREEKDASPAEREVRLCNSGVMGFRGSHLPGLLARIGADNAKGEFYLTDAVGLAVGDGLAAAVVTCPEEEVLGVNDRTQLAEAEATLQTRLRREAMLNGATMVAPETVFLSHDTRIGRDVTIEPHVIFGPGAVVGDGATVKGFSHIEGARIGEGAVVGPFARLRPGADVGEKARVGNFVEIKNATLDHGAKVNHLTYIGDAHIGAEANIGAGTITCNYDGFGKHRTEIGAGAFVGSNSSLVAPVSIGAGAYIGSGSVINRDVSADALALTRAPQVEKGGWAAKFRALKARAKSAVDW
jgi:bifunctional UDP-N-acetylglucosamine pyrophosphorylase/glucosamine-1-phosphate N-acetyltransferase